MTPATRQIFESLDIDGSDTISSHYLINFLKDNGILSDDPRLAVMFRFLEGLGAVANDKPLDLDQFVQAIASCSTIVNRAIKGELRVPDFAGFAQVIRDGENHLARC